MRKFLRSFWATIVSVGTIVGIVYMPADLWGLTATYPGLAKVAGQVDRFWILAAFAASAAAYIAWIDLRPFVIRWKSGRGHRISIHQKIECRSCAVEGTDNLYQNAFYMWVGNEGKSGGTLRRVRATMFLLSDNRPLPISNFAETVRDVQHGEWIQFNLGSIVAGEHQGSFNFPKAEYETARLDAFKHNVKAGYHSFDLPVSAGYGPASLSLNKINDDVWAKWLIGVTISADDTVSRTVYAIIDYYKFPPAITWVNPGEVPSPH